MAVMKQLAIALPVEPCPSLTGAPTGDTDTWHEIDWRQITRNVRRLQARIVKATQEGRWGKVKALQRLLTHSFSGKALAVRRVTENQGKRTAGVDGITWSTPDSKRWAIEKLCQHGYRSQPRRRIYISKKKKGKRPLSIPTMSDRAMEALYKLALDPIAETTGDPNSYGFRKGRAPADAIAQSYILLARKNSAQWILEGDIKACFDKIDHKWLEDHIPMEKPILRQWLKAGYVYRKIAYPTKEGTPQGGIASPVLANMTLDGLEAVLWEKLPKQVRRLVHLVRFADDFIITAHQREILSKYVKPIVEQFLAERGLSLSPEKTHITHIEQGFDFLGQTIRKYNGKFLTRPSKDSIKAFMAKIRTTIKGSLHLSAGQLIATLNPIIRGWANYHRHAASKKTFTRLGKLIFEAIWKWARRRHPNKPAKWVKQKYFRQKGRQKWQFFGIVEGDNGKPKPINLVSIAKIPIKRHTKIRAKANPYDPEWEGYFEKRLDSKMMATLKGKEELHRLWREQSGICPICRQKITKQTGWHSHHVVWRVHGGGDELSNRVLLHPTCHQQVHSQGLDVGKLRPAMGV